MRDDLEQYLFEGKDIGMSIVEHCGFEIAHGVRKLLSHRHQGPEVVYLVEGEMRWNFSDGKSLIQRGGMSHFLKAGISHFPHKSKQTPCHQAWIVLKPLEEISLNGTVFESDDLKSIYGTVSELSGTTRQMGKRLTDDIQEFSTLVKEFKSQPTAFLKSRLRAMICQILLRTTEPCPMKTAQDNSETEVIRLAKEYLDNNLSRPVEMDALAEHLGYSGTWILKVFRNAVGVPPAQYLRRRRIEKAQSLLQDKKLNITDIAFRCGFHSSQHFSQVFRKYTGQSPSQARGN
jgi:AraC-like DNA-binding protein